MAPAEALGVKPGERVLDLCAAPGGKSTQIATALAGEGVLVANDSSPKRVKPLVWNLEHWGARNAIVLNEEPHRLSPVFAGYFHKILVDAPCSGEGMLRKEPKAIRSWSKYGGQACRAMQDALLDQAALMLAEGGRLVYSTCTFNPQENEEAVAAFLDRHAGFRLLQPRLHEGWKEGGMLRECRQLWPHIGYGEGQFFAVMEKTAGTKGMMRNDVSRLKTGRAGADFGEEGSGNASKGDSNRKAGCAELASFLSFMEENLCYPLRGPFAVFGGHVYQIPEGLPDLGGLVVSRPGWHLGTIKNDRFRPSQPFAMGLQADQMKHRLDLEPMEENTQRYLRGETLMVGGEKGLTLVTLKGFPLGFGRQTGAYLKNDYAVGWRQEA